MKIILFFILLFVGANCLSNKLLTDILTQLKESNYGIQTSVDQVNASVANNKKYMTDLHNQSSSSFKMFENKLDKIQKKHTEKIEQIIDQKFASISKDHKNSVTANEKYLDEMQDDLIGITEQLDQKIVSLSEDHEQSALNMNKLQNSSDQLSADINDLHYQSSSKSNLFESNLYELQKTLERTEQIIDQKLEIISEDLQKSALNTEKLQDSVDQLSVNQNETSSTVNQLSASVTESKKYMKEEHNETLSILKTLENKLDQMIVSNSEDHQKLGHQLDTILNVHLYDCLDLSNVGLNVSTSYFLQNYNRAVLCDMETDGGGWLVIQKRRKLTKQVDFNTTWASYKQGFGDLDTEFWIGNEFLHRITNQKSYELRIDMKDFEKGTSYATYSEFIVGNEYSGYQLHVGGFGGNIDDSLKIHNNMKFSTFDRDNDEFSGNCAERFSGGFWYKSCYHANLNGMFPTVPDRKTEKLIRWLYNGEYLFPTNVAMKIRPKQ